MMGVVVRLRLRPPWKGQSPGSLGQEGALFVLLYMDFLFVFLISLFFFFFFQLLIVTWARTCGGRTDTAA